MIAWALMVSAAMFAIGLAGVLARRNLLFALVSIEILLNASALAFVVGGARWGHADGQVMFVVVLSAAAAEAAVGLAIVLQAHRGLESVDGDALGGM